MRLLYVEPTGELALQTFVTGPIPAYAILSHTWGKDEDEVKLHDLTNSHERGKSKAGYRKIEFCAQRATLDGLRYFWIDTCCIDKTSSAELSEAITSMYDWYFNAAKCYVYMSDVTKDLSYKHNHRVDAPWRLEFSNSRWFTRGWTLQELLAPRRVYFYSENGQLLGDKHSLRREVSNITGIAVEALQGRSLSSFSVDERLAWTADRETSRAEDKAYCLIGLFDVSLSVIYGEGERAYKRLLREVYGSAKPNTNLSQSDSKESNAALSIMSGDSVSTLFSNVIASLIYDGMEARLSEIRRPYRYTCNWILSTQQYTDWIDNDKWDDHAGILWISGDRGSGKQVISKFIYQQMKRRFNERVFATFFFDRDSQWGDINGLAIHCYRSLLCQLLETSINTDWLAKHRRLQRQAIVWTEVFLQELIEEAIISLGQQEIIFIIGALDKCRDADVADMLAFFNDISVESRSRGQNVRFWFSGRQSPRQYFEKFLLIVLEEHPAHLEDVRALIRGTLDIGKSPEADDIRNRLYRVAGHNFGNAIRHINALHDAYKAGGIYRAQMKMGFIDSNPAIDAAVDHAD